MIAVIFTFRIYVLSGVLFLVLQETIAIIYFCGGGSGGIFQIGGGNEQKRSIIYFCFNLLQKGDIGSDI